MNQLAFNKIGYGLYVLTARDENKDNGCIINTAIQVTSQPNRIAVTVNKANLTHDMIMKTKKLNISVISEEAKFSLFQHFGFQTGRDTDKFAGYESAARTYNDLYYVTEGTNAYISAYVTETVDLGTHTMFIGDVTYAEVLNDVPSATYAYYHAHIKPQPEKTDKKGFRCKVCGYVYEGDELPADFVCPLCKHGPDDFEKI